jgi:AcrR family transcriptional regulator
MPSQPDTPSKNNDSAVNKNSKNEGKDKLGKSVLAKGAAGKTKRLSLNRSLILNTALNLANQQGLDQLSTRKLAQQLGASPMAIYRHVANKADLLDGMLECVVLQAKLAAPERTEDWQDWTINTLCRMRQVLINNPGVIPLLGSTSVFGTSALNAMELVLSVLRQAGFDSHNAAQCFMSMINQMVGHVAKELNAKQTLNNTPATSDEQWQLKLGQAITCLPSQQFPNVVAMARELASNFSEQGYREAIEKILQSYAPESGLKPQYIKT